MKWAADKLMAGEVVTMKPRGNSMSPLIKDGQEVEITPLSLLGRDVRVGDVVLCKVKHIYLHLVKAIDGGRYQIGNNKGYINGWTSTVYGVVTKIEGRVIR